MKEQINNDLTEKEFAVKSVLAPTHALSVIKDNNFLSREQLEAPYSADEVQALFSKLNALQGIEVADDKKRQERFRKYSSILLSILIYYHPHEISRLSRSIKKISDLKPFIQKSLGINHLQNWFKENLNQGESPFTYLEKAGVMNAYMKLKDLDKDTYLRYFRQNIIKSHAFADNIRKIQANFLNNIAGRVYLTYMVQNNLSLREDKFFLNRGGKTYNFRKVIFYFLLSFSGYNPVSSVYYRYEDLFSLSNDIQKKGYESWSQEMLYKLKENFKIDFSKIEIVKGLFISLAGEDRLLEMIRMCNLLPSEEQGLSDFAELVDMRSKKNKA